MNKKIQNKKIFDHFRPTVQKRGFSIIEVLLSTFLIIVGMSAGIFLISSGLKESMDSRDQLIASGLAQEAVELVRNIRDNNWLQDPSVDSFYRINDGDNCRIDYLYNYNTSNILCGLPPMSLALYRVNDFYIHGAGSVTKFKRKIIIEDDGTDKKNITSMVIWGNSPFPSSVDNCYTAVKCAYVQTILSKWGEDVFKEPNP